MLAQFSIFSTFPNVQNSGRKYNFNIFFSLNGCGDEYLYLQKHS